MSNITVYDKNSGYILRGLSIPDNMIEQQLTDSEDFIEGLYSGDLFYIDVAAKTPIAISEKPNNYSILDWTTKQWINDIDILKRAINLKRLQLLQQSDWTDTVSAQTRLNNYAEWQAYRQALRDITSQSGYPENIVWPEQPI